MKQINKSNVPTEVLNIVETLQNKGFQAWIVGGSVRDLILGLQPKDWDVTTDATPEEIISVFPRTFYENSFGTVGVVTYETEIQKEIDSIPEPLRIIEVTPFRKEGIYKDGRHPEQVMFVKDIVEDLKRRDFTINAIAYDPIKDIIKDMFDGIKDIELKQIVTVGEADKRFSEDYLRMLRAIRLANQLGFNISRETEDSIIRNSNKIKDISAERVRDELVKILMSRTPMVGFLLLKHSQLLKEILPELLMGDGMYQTRNHSYDVMAHLLRCMQHAADKGFNLDLRLASLFHDIAKPHTARWVKETEQNSFHGHEVVGEKITRDILKRLMFPVKQTERICKLVRWHMFNSDPDKVSMSAVRRMIVNVGKENIWDLMNLRLCDRIGSGRPMEEPHRLRRYYAMIEEALTQPTDLKMLKINGLKIMNATGMKPGKKIGLILNALMAEVLEDPERNNETYLESQALQLNLKSEAELQKLAERAKEEIENREGTRKKQIRKKFKV